jgi:hypothetical protein
MFAQDEHAEIFSKHFAGERMHPSERGKGKNWLVAVEKGRVQAEVAGVNHSGTFSGTEVGFASPYVRFDPLAFPGENGSAARRECEKAPI